MDRASFETSIRRAWAFLDSLSIAEHFASPVSLKISDSFSAVAFDDGITYAQKYMAGLSESCYNIMLFDHSYFQFSASLNVGKFRYAYFPNPFRSFRSEDEFLEIKQMLHDDVIDQEEYHSYIGDLNPRCDVPLIRYENAPSQWRGLKHPCSHFHIGSHSDNRWALSRSLTPLAFCMLVGKQYYGNHWSSGDDELLPSGNKFDQLLIDEKMNCRVISDDLFSDFEKRSLHFG